MLCKNTHLCCFLQHNDLSIVLLKISKAAKKTKNEK